MLPPPGVLRLGGTGRERRRVTGEEGWVGRVGEGACRNALGQPSGAHSPLQGEEAHHLASWGFGPTVGRERCQEFPGLCK